MLKSQGGDWSGPRSPRTGRPRRSKGRSRPQNSRPASSRPRIRSPHHSGRCTTQPPAFVAAPAPAVLEPRSRAGDPCCANGVCRGRGVGRTKRACPLVLRAAPMRSRPRPRSPATPGASGRKRRTPGPLSNGHGERAGGQRCATDGGRSRARSRSGWGAWRFETSLASENISAPAGEGNGHD